MVAANLFCPLLGFVWSAFNSPLLIVFNQSSEQEKREYNNSKTTSSVGPQ